VVRFTFFVGKGGVGKTTVSSAYALQQAAKRPRRATLLLSTDPAHSLGDILRTKLGDKPKRLVSASDGVTICSIDPAPSLDDIFAAEVGSTLRPVLGDPRLRAAEFDAIAEFQQWAGQLRVRLDEAMTGEEHGVHVDLSLDRRFLLALLDVVPPGVDEIFATFGILDRLDEKERIVIDMAPTAHALEVLRTPDRLLAWAGVDLVYVGLNVVLTSVETALRNIDREGAGLHHSSTPRAS
jgi:anion-transporting  ArsA/GET3 family ATPase